MDYKQTVNWLFEHLPMFQRVGEQAYKKDLGNISVLCKLLNEPQHSFQTIHIAGTNGKGSTSHGLASVFQAAGYKTGLYTSPHYVDFRERIRINGNMISESEVVSFVDKYKDGWKDIQPSFFEITVAMAFDHFRNLEVDIAIIETGLGGRLDSTNIILPKLSVITNIGYDHMNLLGETLEEIASEKAGIIKNEVPVVVGEWDEITAPIFEGKAAECNSEIVFASLLYDITVTAENLEYSEYLIYIKENESEFEFNSDLTGAYQQNNLRTIWAALQVWNRMYPSQFISLQQIGDGFSSVKSKTGLMGRWMKIQSSPLVLTDAAHNEHGIKAMLPRLLELQVERRHFVLGFVADKDIRKVLRHFPVDAAYYWVKPNLPRGLDSVIVKAVGEDLNLIGENFNDIHSAYHAALKNATVKDLIFIGGSSYVVGDFLNSISTDLHSC